MFQSFTRSFAVVAFTAACLASTSSVAPTQESCRDISRGVASDGSNDELIVRECRKPRDVAAAISPAAAPEIWSPGPANDPETCKELWGGIGLPEKAGSIGGENTIVCRGGYVLSHNNEARIPDWVLERLKSDLVSGNNNRPETPFKKDPAVPPPARADKPDYALSKYAIGHQAPSEDFNNSKALMVETFFFSNVAPQIGAGFNGSIWRVLENRVRTLTKKIGELYVITGPIYQDENGRSQTITPNVNACSKTIRLDAPRGQIRKQRVCAANNRDPSVPCGEAGAAVPSALYKILYDPINKRVMAYVLPNIDHTDERDNAKPDIYLERFRTTVHAVEAFTGLQFFSALPLREQSRRRQDCMTTFVH